MSIQQFNPHVHSTHQPLFKPMIPFIALATCVTITGCVPKFNNPQTPSTDSMTPAEKACDENLQRKQALINLQSAIETKQKLYEEFYTKLIALHTTIDAYQRAQNNADRTRLYNTIITELNHLHKIYQKLSRDTLSFYYYTNKDIQHRNLESFAQIKHMLKSIKFFNAYKTLFFGENPAWNNDTFNVRLYNDAFKRAYEGSFQNITNEMDKALAQKIQAYKKQIEGIGEAQQRINDDNLLECSQ